MPVDPGNQLTEAFRLAQARLGAATVTDMAAAWRLLDPRDLDATTARWLRVTRRIVEARRLGSVNLAADFMRAIRAVQLGTAERFVPVLAEPLPIETMSASLVATGPARLKAATAAGYPLERASELAFSDVAGTAHRQVLDGGRDTVLKSVEHDPRALGWARATSGSPCAFCAMLASRGPVYRAEDTADFKPHGRCGCIPKPIYSPDDPWPLGSERFREIWDTHAKGQRDPEAAFRRHLESDPEFRDARNARRRELYRERREASSST